MRVALAQINPVLADFEFNSKLITQKIAELHAKKAKLIVFPEASLFGYHPFDLLERKKLVLEQNRYLKKILKSIPKDCYALIGGFEINEDIGRPFYNSAFLCTKNKIVRTFRKELLPTGDVFDEARFVEKGQLKNNYFQIGNERFFLTICEDIWAWDNKDYKINPLKFVIRKKVSLVINMSASPFFLPKMDQRKFVATKTAQYFKAPVLYVNMVGAQDEVIFDGRSFLIDQKGKVIFQQLAFEEDTNVFDLTNMESWSKRKTAERQVDLLRKSIILGIKDYVAKTGFGHVHLGLSGGIDSAVVAALAVDAVGPQNVSLFALPTQFNHPESYTAANELSKNLNCKLAVFSIQKIFEQVKSEFDLFFEIKEFSLVHENIQSRIRGLFLMAYSNLKQSLLLTTGNKSEYATGYATLYGDMCGGLAPIGDLTKRQVYEIARSYNVEGIVIPEFIINRPPSAELRPNQKDQDSLPPYEQLDKAVTQIVEHQKNASSVTEKWLLQKLMVTEFKRWQSPPILKVTEHSFGRGRRYPIAHRAKF
jgi:NAD+ synthase (glutamine-hydrolysing)